MDVAVVEVDTRVDPRGLVGRRARDVEAALTVEELSPPRLHELVAWVLADEARDLALECAERAANQLDEVRAAFTSVVGCRPVAGR